METALSILGIVLTGSIALIGWLLKLRVAALDTKQDSLTTIIKSYEFEQKTALIATNAELARIYSTVNGIGRDLSTHMAMQSERNAVVASNIQVLFEKVERQYEFITNLERQMAKVAAILDEHIKRDVK